MERLVDFLDDFLVEDFVGFLLTIFFDTSHEKMLRDELFDMQCS